MTSRHRATTDANATLPLHLKKNGTVINTQVTTIVSVVRECDDVVTPGYRDMLRQGVVVNNSCDIFKETNTAGGGTVDINNGTTFYTVSGGGSVTKSWLQRKGYPSYTSAVLDLATLDQLVKNEALANVDKAPNSLLEDILEVRQTLLLFKDPLATFRNLSRVFNGKVQDLINGRRYSRLRASAETWAAVKWGFLPVVRSFDNLMTSLTNSSYYTKPGSIKVANASAPVFSFVNENPKKFFGSGRYDEYNHTHGYTGSAKAYVIYRVNNPMNDWRSEVGLRTKDIPEGLWNIVPWSFLVDKVFNVSAAISGMVALSDPSIDILGGGVVHKYVEAETWKFLTQVDPPYTANVSSDTWLRTREQYDRTVWTPSVKDLIPVTQWRGLVQDASSITDSLAASLLILGGGSTRRKYTHGRT